VEASGGVPGGTCERDQGSPAGVACRRRAQDGRGASRGGPQDRPPFGSWCAHAGTVPSSPKSRQVPWANNCNSHCRRCLLARATEANATNNATTKATPQATRPRVLVSGSPWMTRTTKYVATKHARTSTICHRCTMATCYPRRLVAAPLNGLTEPTQGFLGCRRQADEASFAMDVHALLVEGAGQVMRCVIGSGYPYPHPTSGPRARVRVRRGCP